VSGLPETSAEYFQNGLIQTPFLGRMCGRGSHKTLLVFGHDFQQFMCHYIF